MEIKESLEKIMAEVKNDPKLLEEFKKDPAAAAKKIVGDDLPDGLIEKATELLKSEGGNIEKVLESVKDKVDVSKLGGAFDALKKIL